MNDLPLSLGVVLLFTVRIGVPMLIFIALGLLVDRWQCCRERRIAKLYRDQHEIQPGL